MSATAPGPPQKRGPSLDQVRLPNPATPTPPVAPTSSAALYNFRLLSALRSDDPAQVQPFLDELKAGSGADHDSLTKAGMLLSMAARVGSVPIFQRILTSPKLSSPNIKVNEGQAETTCLHVASEHGRADIVQLLLVDSRIDDTIRDGQGRTALECASTPEISTLIENSRAGLQMDFIAKLASYISSPLSSPEARSSIVDFLNGPRTEILNLNAIDEKSGTTLIHEAARRRDAQLVELAVKKGADVFARDKRGKRVLDGEKAPDERIKAFLRQFNNSEALVQPKSDGRPPDLKGFLSKWVNYRTGWRSRWFVLENGMLSYYRSREDEPVACRGSISMAIASISPSHDNSRFELHSKISSAVPKIIVKSAHRAEIARWVQAINLNIEYYRKHQDQTGVAQPKRSSSMNTTASSKPVASALNALPPTDSFINAKLQRSASGLTSASLAQHNARNPSPTRTADTRDDADEADTISIFDATDERSIIDTSSGLPHEDTFDMSVINMKAQLEMLHGLFQSLDFAGQADMKEAVSTALTTMSYMVSQQNVMTQDRERYLLGRIQREVDARKMWEENMMEVAAQQAETDRQLTEAARTNEKKRKALRQAKDVLAGITAQGSFPTSPAMENPPLGPSQPASAISLGALATGSTTTTSSSFHTAPPTAYHRPSVSISNIQEVHAALQDAESEDDDNDDDEFFDAIEQNAIPNLKLHDSIAFPEKDRPGTPTILADTKQQTGILDVVKQTPPAYTQGTMKEYLARKSLEPYLQVRARLPIDDDKRPSVSLWGILKSSVGKDLTKISFPVSFNECTSMLQRMAEDMEYDACLTVAAQQQDPLKRIAFVAAFAMSNYSSTIGRIAKPFNPLLSQSFEYAIPNRYRYVSEQVSHHPPMSACYCEAPTWKYFGEVDAQNKFQGRSFEIRPTGVAHAELIIPKKWVHPDDKYPEAGAEYGSDLVKEHYSWKKVTTNVSNFIMGTPIIDHYGDMVVTNHRTGETCTLTFKPRGWRSKDAMEIKGIVTDSNGRTAWDIAGRWDTQLIAREASASGSPLDADTTFKDSQKEYLLLWRNSDKPKAPFNLTPYAVTLNDIPKGLEPYLCPTDCRLRTDMRAFENAQYERAQELKSLNEEHQRNTRKLRAEGRLPPHEARWFEAQTDPDSGERVWIPKRAEDGEVRFWHEREMAPETKWQDVEHIFVE